MKIAFFTDTYLPTVDGVVRSILTTRRQLESDGHEVVVFAPDDPRSQRPREPGTVYLRALEYRAYPGYRIAAFPDREWELVEELGIDVIHSHGLAALGLKGLWSSRKTKVPLLQTFHTMLQDALPFYSPSGISLGFLENALRVYLRLFLRRCRGIVVPSRAILGEIIALAPDATIADVIPTGVDPDLFHPGVDGHAVRDRWGLEGNDVVLHVGRLSPEKNLGMLIRGFRFVKEANPDAKLVIVGRGPYMGRYYDIVRRLDLAGDVIFTGFVPEAELPQYYAAADIFATASRFETQGLSVLEALASGRPVAGANFRAIPEFVQDGRNGVLFDPGDVRDCADAILRCLRRRDAMSEAARESVIPFSTARCTRRLETMYARLLTP